ncbi:MAG: acetyl-CoA C-acetyltransferase [Rubrobacteraceae bacterium]|uniref:thiolase family protein n=1 Tax=Rubrobacter naiadicus TaxID=1392641 RepID=UPI00235FF708|nr:acetyl-CoA C-acetyltransferase [Rubrobacter naiadicus]MBX6762273.1 acetyl-CoA C-acetyltransferase [Rubrobacteraceae bacterium]MCL6436964.1 acetyl-CoA C-acetyltransferase [Rubrobacteraceae bacterium]
MSFGNNGTEIVVSTPLRTAIGTFGGALKDVPATELGATVAREVISRSGVEGEQVDQVIVGNILSAGQGMNPGRQVGIKAGLPVSVPGMTLNRMCGSGLQAIVSAAQEVALGDAEVVLAGGIESMDQAPFLLPRARYGYRMGMPGGEILDHMVYDGLWDVFNDYHMGVTAENVAEKYGVSREDQDAYAARSHQRAARAIQEGYFEEQIVPVEVKQKKETIRFTTDEHVRPNTSVESLARLKPVFKRDGGTVTAGNSSGINDGAAMMLVTTDRKAEELDLPVAGRLVSAAVTGVDPALMGTGMIPASRMALKKAGLSIEDMDIVEANEAFASIAVTVGRELGVPEERLNPLGGAVALGHPIGATGAILTVKILHELRRTGGRYGLVTLCIGGGMGIAAIFERIS